MSLSIILAYLIFGQVTPHCPDFLHSLSSVRLYLMLGILSVILPYLIFGQVTPQLVQVFGIFFHLFIFTGRSRFYLLQSVPILLQSVRLARLFITVNTTEIEMSCGSTYYNCIEIQQENSQKCAFHSSEQL